MSFLVFFLVFLRHVNQARGFQNMGATGTICFLLFFFQKQFLSNRLMQYPLTRTLPVVPVPVVAEEGYSCPNGIPTVTICLLFHPACTCSFLTFVARENCRASYPDPFKHNTADFYGGLTPLAAEMTKDFFVSASIYPQEYEK